MWTIFEAFIEFDTIVFVLCFAFFFFFFFAERHVDILTPDQGSNQNPLQWKEKS